MARHSFSSLSAGIAITLLSLFARPAAGQNYKSDRATLGRWIASTDARLDFVGEYHDSRINPFDILIIYCSRRKDNVCGGRCTVYTGAGDRCLRTDGRTDCLAATHDITHCATETCSEHCNEYARCGVRLDSGFCWTPSTSSIQIPIINEVPVEDTVVVAAATQTGPSSHPFGLPETNSPAPSPSNTVVQQESPAPPILPNNAPVASASGAPVSAVSSQEGTNALSPGAIAGIVLGVLFMLAASICAVIWLRYKTRQRRASTLIDSTPRPFLAPSPASSSRPIPSSYPTESPPMQQYHRSPPTDYDMESMYTSNPGYPMSVSSMSYATTPSMSHVPPSRSGPGGSTRHDRTLQPVNRIDEDDDEDDDGRSFGHYLVNPDPHSRAPHRVDSGDARPHYS